MSVSAPWTQHQKRPNGDIDDGLKELMSEDTGVHGGAYGDEQRHGSFFDGCGASAIVRREGANTSTRLDSVASVDIDKSKQGRLAASPHRENNGKDEQETLGEEGHVDAREENFDHDDKEVDDGTAFAESADAAENRFRVDGGCDGAFSHLPIHLDRSTVRAIGCFLTEFDAKNAALDDDEVFFLMTKTNRNVEHRIRYSGNPCNDMVDQKEILEEFKREEEDYLVGHDLVKEMTTKLNKERRRPIDKRTVNWVKRAAGLTRKNYHSPHSAVSMTRGETDSARIGQGGGKSTLRRYTRGMAKSTRIKKQEQLIFRDKLGLNSILNAIEELEPQAGPYPVPFECAKKGEKPLRLVQIVKESDGESDNKPDKRFDPALQRPLVARITEEASIQGQARNGRFIFGDHRDILLVRILVDGDHVEEDDVDKMSMRERKRELKRLRDRQYQKRRRDRKVRERAQRRQSLARPAYTTPIRCNNRSTSDFDGDSNDDVPERHRKCHAGDAAARILSLKGPLSLAHLDWQRRQTLKPCKKAQKEAETPTSNIDFTRSYGMSRLPIREKRNNASKLFSQGGFVAPPRNRHSDDVYASCCHKLINCLSGNSRSWAMHEFFYSDIDHAFYNSNSFVKQVATIGILPNVTLTRSEWSLVRRMIRKRPRRFSKRFILSQLKERNKFRNVARHFQAHPEETNRFGLALPTPIEAGTTVTAFNKKFLILHRGVVLFHDMYSARYLVQFERKELGFELCSDTEVSSHGFPNNIRSTEACKLSGSVGAIVSLSAPVLWKLPSGMSCCPQLTRMKTKGNVTCQKELKNLVSGKLFDSNAATGNFSNGSAHPNLERIAERETLVSLLSVIDAATSRKAMLLDMMEKFNVLLMDRVVFGESVPSDHVVSGYFQQHHSWLRANVETTNRALDKAIEYLEVMYGKAFIGSLESDMTAREKKKNMFVESMMSQDRRVCGGPPSVALHWIAALHHGSKDVGNYFASLVLRQVSALTAVKRSGTALDLETGDTFIRNRVSAAAAALAALAYCCGRSDESDIALPGGDSPLVDVVLASGVFNLPAPRVAKAARVGVVKQTLTEREAANEDLNESFAFLGKEFTSLLFVALSNIPNE